jgi:hypothetical protein
LPHPDSPEFAAAYEAAEMNFRENKSSERRRLLKGNAAPPLVPKSGAAERTLDQVVEMPKDSKEGAPTYLTPEEVVIRWKRRIDIDTLANWRSKKQSPTYHRFGRVILYRSDLLAAWEAKNMIACDPLPAVSDDEGDRE